MPVLYVILGIILFFVIILSVRITVSGEFFESFTLYVSWLFLKFKIFPMEKKPKKKKNSESKKKNTNDTPQAQDSSHPEKENIFVTFYKNQGFNGVVELINNAAYSLARMLNSFKKHIVIRELYLWMIISGGNDAAETALEYGRVCQRVFPALSFICSTLPVKKYDAEIEPDFLANKNSAEFAFSISLRPIFFINAGIVLVFRLLFKVVLKFLKGIKKNKNLNENIKEGGAL